MNYSNTEKLAIAALFNGCKIKRSADGGRVIDADGFPLVRLHEDAFKRIENFVKPSAENEMFFELNKIEVAKLKPKQNFIKMLLKKIRHENSNNQTRLRGSSPCTA